MATRIIDLLLPSNLPLLGTELLEMSEGGVKSVKVAVNEALTRLYADGSVILTTDSTTGITVLGDVHCDDLFTSGDTIHVGTGLIKSTAGNIELYYAGTKTFETTTAGIKLNLGAATINEFSIDGTLAGDSDVAVPTEKAVKTYVDTQIATTDEHNELLGLQGGDSTSEFYHLDLQTFSQISSDATSVIFSGDIYANDLFVSGTTINVGTGQIKSTAGNVELYYGGDKKVETTATGIEISDDIHILGNSVVEGDTHILGDAIIDGTTFIVNTEVMIVEDPVITVNSGGVPFSISGIEIDRGISSNYQIVFQESDDTFRAGFIGNLREVAFVDSLILNHNDLQGLQGGDSTSEFYHLDVQLYNQLSSTPTSVLLSDDLDVTGHVAIGNGANPNSVSLLYAREDFNSAFAIGAWIHIDNAANNAGATSLGLDSTVQNDTSTLHGRIQGVSAFANATAASATITTIMGTGSRVSVTGNNTTVTEMISGDFDIVTAGPMINLSITDMIGGRFQILKLGSGETNITNGYGALIKTPGYTSSGTITNLYGLYIEDQSTVGFTNDYNIFSAGVNSSNKFEGSVDIDGTLNVDLIDSTALVVSGDIHCDDLFTSGSSIHLGNIQLTEDASGLKVNKLKLQSGAQVDEFSTDTALGSSDTKVPTQSAVKTYVDTQIGLGIETGNYKMSTADTTADIVFIQQQGSLNYSIAYSIVNTVDNPPLLFVSGVFEKTVDGFKVMFSSPMDTDNYELSWIVTDALLGSSSSSSISSSSISSSSSSRSSSSSSSSLSAVPASWTEFTDDTYWSPSDGMSVWSGSAWITSGSGDGTLTEVGTWVEGYRPTKIRVTHNSIGLNINCRDASSNNMCNTSFTASGAEVTLTDFGEDIELIQFATFGGGDQITKIEFFG
jgi:hypothetical protein